MAVCSALNPTRSRLTPCLIASLMLAACASSPSHPRPPGDGGRPARAEEFQGLAARPISLFFASLDTNKDRTVDTEELNAGVEAEWRDLSASGPVRALMHREWAEAVLGAEDASPSFLAFDVDVSGAISREEFGDRLRSEFAQLDVDRSGDLDRSEMVFLVTPRRPEQANSPAGLERRVLPNGRRPARR